jgi:AcrR family transcriptional regulator
MSKVRKHDAQAAQAGRYHHGDLKAALVRAADEILAEEGLEGFSLRAAARRAGVSVAAPAHHFGSAAGLLSEVAALGFIELARHLEVPAGRISPGKRLRRQGVGYVRFALTHPGRFHLMFRRDLLDEDHPGLREAGESALAQLEQTVRAKHKLADREPLNSAARSMLLAAWSLVHGFAHLLLDGKLAHMHAGATSDDLLEKVLPQMLLSQWPD